MNLVSRILRGALLVLAAAGIGVWGWRTFGSGRSGGGGPSGSGGADVPEPARLVLVTYFTSDQRCPTCLRIEKLTREAVEAGFARELEDGRVRFQTVNFDRPGNRHFCKDYELTFKTVVVSDRRNGKEERWAKFDKVWDLVDDPAGFSAYLRDGIAQYLDNARHD